jgi:L-asparagine transporter-like permease
VVVVVVVVAYLVGLQARRSASSGSLGTFAGNALGPLAAFTSGWSLIIGYLAFAASAFVGAEIYLTAFLDKIHLGVSSTSRAPADPSYAVERPRALP